MGHKKKTIDMHALAVLLEELPHLYGRRQARWMTAGAIIDCLYEVYKSDRTFDALRTAVDKLCWQERNTLLRPRVPTAQHLGRNFRVCVDQVIAGKRLVVEHDEVLEACIWRVKAVSD